MKDETKQASGAFKFRGSAHAVAQLPAQTPLVTASTGNHAAGLALAAACAHVSLRVYVPSQTPLIKLQRILDARAEVVPVNGVYDDCEAHARDYSRQTRARFVHSFDDPLVISGHRSLYREVTRQAGNPDVAFVPIGGGGLISAGLLQWSKTRTSIIGVEYDQAPAMKLSLEAGSRIVLDDTAGPPEGLLVRKVGRISFALCHYYSVRIQTIGDADLRHAMRVLWNEAGIRAEGAGAAAVAAALAFPDSHSVALCVVSGGNIDPETWRSWIE